MIRAMYRTQEGHLKTKLLMTEFKTALQDTGGLLWVDLFAEPREVSQRLLEEIFGFHPLAVDDALEEAHSPKVDDWGDYLYLVVRAVDSEPEVEGELDTCEVDTFVGRNYVVTYHEEAVAAVERVWSLCQRDERHLNKGNGHLLYILIDEIVADYMPIVEVIDEAVNQIEDQVFDNPKPVLLGRIFALKRDLLHLRRTLAPQREVINKLARGDFAVIEPEAKIFFRDVYDHLVRLYDITESLRDLMSSALDSYLSVVNNRLNDTMKTLTIITTFFMPISFITGFFGMNFFQPVIPLEQWTGWPAFLAVLLTMVLLPTGMYFWIRRRAWM